MTARDPSPRTPTPAIPRAVFPASDAVAQRATSPAVDPRASAVQEDSDHVGDDSMQSFPASDPPGWISMWLGAPTNAEHL